MSILIAESFTNINLADLSLPNTIFSFVSTKSAKETSPKPKGIVYDGVKEISSVTSERSYVSFTQLTEKDKIKNNKK